MGREGRHNQMLKSREAQRDEMKMGHSDQSHPETDEQIHLA